MSVIRTDSVPVHRATKQRTVPAHSPRANQFNSILSDDAILVISCVETGGMVLHVHAPHIATGTLCLQVSIPAYLNGTEKEKGSQK
jgi:hypothetical protein